MLFEFIFYVKNKNRNMMIEDGPPDIPEDIQFTE